MTLNGIAARDWLKPAAFCRHVVIPVRPKADTGTNELRAREEGS
jgi:hypothetical protein